MKSIGFPNMFNGSVSIVASDHQATTQNLKLALLSYRGEFYGDPDYGSNVITILYSQNSGVLLEDIITDDIYTCIKKYIPQLKLDRKDISLEETGLRELSCTIKATNLLDGSDNLYEIALLEPAEQ